MAQEVSRLFIVSAPCKVSPLFRKVRVGVGLDLDVSSYTQEFQQHHLISALLFLGGFSGGRKRPFVSGDLPVMAMQPGLGLFRVSAAHHDRARHGQSRVRG